MLSFFSYDFIFFYAAVRGLYYDPQRDQSFTPQIFILLLPPQMFLPPWQLLQLFLLQRLPRLFL